ncbi:serine/threonine protein kinase [Serratia sp. CY83965]|uniref:serine/threonine protein kinase n=1 Tax=Serratia sp. CY83965 TaxID=3383693 RepID=UPI003FA0176B
MTHNLPCSLPENLPQVLWTENISFEKNWRILIENMAEGGQGVGHKVISKNGIQIAFLKIMHEVGSTERRTRFFNEARAYSFLSDAQVPKIIESNANLYKNKDIKLYIVTEFIEGLTLQKWRNKVGNISLDRAIAITLQLLDTIGLAHEAGILHRDIKPDNIIMKEDDTPVLIDFGIAYNKNDEEIKQLTRINDALGNRFLLLPELAGGSDDKRNPVSDLTAIAGVFFFLITGKKPSILQDQKGKLPHQRNNSLPYFSEIGRTSILNFFDKAFSYHVSDRYQTEKFMANALHKVLNQYLRMGPSTRREQLFELLDNATFKSRGERSLRIRDALNWAMGMYSSVVSDISSGNLRAHQTDMNDSKSPGYVRIRWDLAGEYLFSSYLWVEAIGGEFVWYTTIGEVYRASMDTIFSQDYPTTFIQNAVEADMHRILSQEPKDILPEFSCLHTLRDSLTYTWNEALVLSKALSLPVVAIVYDCTQPIAHREHLLDRVLGDDIVQTTIRSTFVLLISKRSSMPECLGIPTGSDYLGIIVNGEWTEQQNLAANRQAARILFSTLKDKFSRNE